MKSLLAWIFALSFTATALAAADFPAPEQLPAIPDLPDPLLMADGSRVSTVQQWESRRKPELQALFQHYIYGQLPPAPKGTPVLRSVHRDALGGKATIKQIGIPLGTPGGDTLELLLVLPNQHPAGGAAVIFGINHCGNHGVLADPRIALTTKRLDKFPNFRTPDLR